MTTHSTYINALLVERVGYIARGLTDRVRQIDDALREVGYDHPYLTTETATITPDAERAIKPKARRRTKG